MRRACADQIRKAAAMQERMRVMHERIRPVVTGPERSVSLGDGVDVTDET